MYARRETAESKCKIDRIDVIRSILIEWGRENFDNFPWRTTHNHFHALIAEVMLQRTKAEQVLPIYSSFVTRYKTVHNASANSSSIIELLKPLGLNWRIKKIIELINELDLRGGKIPNNYTGLIELSGVGSYVASAYLSFHLGIKASIVDSNAVRLWSRFFGLKKNGEMRRKKELLMLVDEITPEIGNKNFNYAVLDLTRKICKSKPLCNDCPLSCYCEYYKQHKVR